jgi:hypothetical protein
VEVSNRARRAVAHSNRLTMSRRALYTDTVHEGVPTTCCRFPAGFNTPLMSNASEAIASAAATKACNGLDDVSPSMRGIVSSLNRWSSFSPKSVSIWTNVSATTAKTALHTAVCEPNTVTTASVVSSSCCDDANALALALDGGR